MKLNFIWFFQGLRSGRFWKIPLCLQPSCICWEKKVSVFISCLCTTHKFYPLQLICLEPDFVAPPTLYCSRVKSPYLVDSWRILRNHIHCVCKWETHLTISNKNDTVILFVFMSCLVWGWRLGTRVRLGRVLEYELSLIWGPVQNQIFHPRGSKYARRLRHSASLAKAYQENSFDIGLDNLPVFV